MSHPPRLAPLAASLLLLLGSLPAAPAELGAQTPPEPPKVTFPAASPASTVKQRVGTMDVEVEYSRPGKNGREIFGKLVPFNEVWRTGANASTKITFSDAVKFAGKDVPAGKYALYTIPTAGEWTVILYKDLSLWGAYKYKQADDFARLTVKHETVAAAPLESFTIGFDDVKEDGATLFLAWDTLRVPVKISVDTNAKVMAAIIKATAPEAAPAPQLLAQSANYFLTHNGDLAKALGWMNTAIEKMPPAYYLHDRKSRIQAKMGDRPGALASAQKALEVAKADPDTASDAETMAGLQKQVDGLR